MNIKKPPMTYFGKSNFFPFTNVDIKYANIIPIEVCLEAKVNIYPTKIKKLFHFFVIIFSIISKTPAIKSLDIDC